MPSATGSGEAQIASLVAHEGILTKFSESQTPKTLGTGTKTMLLTERSRTWVYEFFESEEGAGKIVKSVSPTPSGPSGSYKAAGG